MRVLANWLAPFLVLVSGTGITGIEQRSDTLSRLTADVVNAGVNGEPAPVLSARSENTFSYDTAYRIQRLAVTQWLGAVSPAGFKAGLTSNAGQKKFAVDGPVAGVLLPKGRLQAVDGVAVIKLRDFNTAMFEAEIGFLFRQRIGRPVASIKALKSNVAFVLPVVEVPDLAFDRTGFKGVDIVANNVLARQFITGRQRPAKGIDLDALTVVIDKDKQTLLKGRGSDAMGSQWQALLWLVNKTIANGWQIEPGQLLITGALGRMLPAKAGQYHIDFGDLGQIDFIVQ